MVAYRRGEATLTSTIVLFETVRADVQVVATLPGDPPFPLDAVVLEEDTYLVLSAEATLRLPGEHPLRVIHAAFDARPEPIGSVLVRAGDPLRLLAVVHDLSQDTTCRPEWVEVALERVLAVAEERRLRSLGLPLLGTVHGRVAPQQAAALLATALDRARPASLRQLWLILDPPVARDARREIEPLDPPRRVVPFRASD